MDPTSQAFAQKWPSLAQLEESETESHDGREEALLKYILALDPLPDTPNAVLTAIDSFSLNHSFLISVGPHKAAILRDLIAQQKPKVLLELGGYLGYSAILFAEKMREVHGASLPKIISLEPSPLFASISQQLISLAGLDSLITIIVGTASSSIPNLQLDKQSVDFLFLDHIEDLYIQDFQIVEQQELFSGNAMVVADNVVRPGAEQYRNWVRGEGMSGRGWRSRGVRGLIWPGEWEDELEVSTFSG
ncbi:catechol O-methyltransferase protein [Rutstroemia sp. NJR-2017a WRK4]|nr:catechol O-methyltransferase protein [Rutstroemia sp. NJR-2017a WRK4]